MFLSKGARSFLSCVLLFLATEVSLAGPDPMPSGSAGGILVVPHEVDHFQRHVPTSKKGMVVSATRLASEAGAQVLERGGNAADAAVATAFALAVTWPEAGNLGGGGFCLTKMPGRPIEALDHRETAPQAARPEMYLDAQGEIIPEASTLGWKAVAVPGSAAGLELLHKRLGHLDWKSLVEPAEVLAREGFIVDAGLLKSILRSQDKLVLFEASKKIFLPRNIGDGKGGHPPELGTLFVQKDLAQSLSEIAKKGSAAFYEGSIAQALADAMKKEGGLITDKDLVSYQAVWRQPVSAQFGDYEVHSMPPPSSGGGTLISMLRILEALGLDQFEKQTPFNAKEIDVLTHAMKFAFRDRALFYGDPDFAQIPLNTLVSLESAQWAAAEIRKRLHGRVIPATEVKTFTQQQFPQVPALDGKLSAPEGNTTHFSVADGRGGWVSCTTTLNSAFGSGVVAPGTGIVLNNEMDDFTSQVGKPNLYGLIQGQNNAIAPGKRPLSSMTPTLITRGSSGQSGKSSTPDKDEVIAAIGTPGGPTIINQVLLITLGLFVKQWDPVFAVSAPRFHHQWQPDVLFAEPNVFSSETIDVLLSMGHNVTIRSHPIGAAHVIVHDHDGFFQAGADPRLAGYAAYPK